MKKLNTYLMGMMSVAVCLFSVACSSDDEETAPKEDGIVTVEAVFANDGLTRALIGDNNASGRSMTFETTDILRLVDKSNSSNYYDFEAQSGSPITFSGQLPKNNQNFANYTAYLLSKDNKTSGIPSYTVGTARGSLQEAFTKDAIISGGYTNNKYVLSLQNAFVVNNSSEGKSLYCSYSGGSAERGLAANGGAVAVAADVILKKVSTNPGTSAVANTIYVFDK